MKKKEGSARNRCTATVPGANTKQGTTEEKRLGRIVTDDLSIGQSIQRYFENDQTTQIHCASSVSQALDRMVKDSYSLLIIDLQLFGMDRMEMVRILRFAKQIPILALTETLGDN